MEAEGDGQLKHDPLCDTDSPGNAVAPQWLPAGLWHKLVPALPFCFCVQLIVYCRGAWEQPLLPHPSLQKAAAQGASAGLPPSCHLLLYLGPLSAGKGKYEMRGHKGEC